MYLKRIITVNLFMRIIYVLLLHIIFTSFNAIGQQMESQKIRVNGEIIDAKDNSPVPFVHVINVTSSKGAVSNTQGRFNMLMDKTDTLIFSAIGFEKYIFTLSKEINTKAIRVTIVLDDSSLELEPVKVFAYKDEQSLKRAIIAMKLPDEKPKKMQLDGLGFYYGPRKEAKISPVWNPISFVYGRVSKMAKEKRKYAKVTAEYHHWMTSIYQKYNPQIVQELTGLPEDKVEDFMKFCKLGDSFISLSSEYEVAVEIHKCLTEYSADTFPEDSLRDN